MNGANNAGTSFGSSILFANTTDSFVRNVVIKNARHPGQAIGDVGLTNKNNYFFGTTIHGYGTAPCAGGILTTAKAGRIINNFADALCDSAFVANGDGDTNATDILIADNHVESSTAAATSAPFIVESTSRARLQNNACNGPTNSGCYRFSNAGAVPESIAGGQVEGNSCGANAAGAPVVCMIIESDGTRTVSGIAVGPNFFSGSSNVCVLLDVQGAVANKLYDISFTGLQCSGGTGGILVGDGSSRVNISGGMLFGASGSAVTVQATTNAVTITSVDMNNNGQDLSDASGTAKYCLNRTDSTINGQCNMASTGAVNCTAANITGSAGVNFATALSGTSRCTDIILTPTGAVTAFALSGGSASSASLLVQFTQGGTGFAVNGLAGNITNACAVSALANAVTTWTIHYDSAGDKYNVIACSSTDPSILNGCASSTGNDTYTCTLTSALSALNNFVCVVLKADTTNTGAATLNVTGLGGSALGAVSILNRAGGALADGDITANQPITLCYNSTGPSWTIQGDGAGSGSGNFAYSQGVTAAVTQTGSYVTLYSTPATVPALAAGSCYFIGFSISDTGAGVYAVQLFVDGASKATVVPSNTWTGLLIQNEFAYCNNAGVQNAQSIIYRTGFYCTGVCLTGGNLSQMYTFFGGTPITPTAVDWSTGSKTISIRTTQPAGSLIGNMFYIRQ